MGLFLYLCALMDSTRQQKVARLIQKELGEYFMRDGRMLYGNVMVSVTDLRVSPDLSVARIHISIFPNEAREKTLSVIEANTRRIRMEIGQGLKNQLRKIPDLYFYIDDTFDRVQHIENLLKK